MMFPAALGLFICALLLQTASGECPGEAPTKNLLCYVEVISSQFDPCLCTHLVLQTPLEKLTPQSELLLSARRLQERNPLLRIVLQVSESADVVLKKRSGYAQTVAQAVSKNSLDGVELALQWGKQVAGKVQLVDFVQGLSKELDKLEPKDRSKRSYEIYENIPSDTVTPRWTLSANRKKSIRKIREVEDTDEEKETTTMKEDEEGKEATTTEEVKETSPKQEILEEPESEEKTIQIILHLTSEPQHLAKNFDLKRLSKYVSMYTLASDNLTDSSERGHTYHPSRLMGIEDILNADSLIDLVTGLGAPREKLVLSLPATALKFTLQDKGKNLPQSKTTGEPSKITRAELCTLMAEGEWTVERDEDLTAPYAFHDTTWLAFDDPTSVSIKGKYVLLRDLSGAAVYNADAEDWVSKCNSSGPAVLKTLHDIFTHISRQSRAAQLVSLQEQLHEAGQFSYSGDVHLSPYRIVRVVDREGSIHVVRKEAKTEFECSRQGYFRHPSGCNRFYRCVKFNQYTPDFTVFEYDCPAGLAFDETVEVCVWPGSLADGGACQGSSEIAPVPRSRYVCPQVAGYYADPENCRWFFACLDHSGDGSALTAYEFRCPFGLVFDEQALVCNWPWLVPGCGGAGVYRARFTVGDFYEGRHRPSYASLSDVHVSGGRIENVPGGVVLDSSVSGLGSGAYLGSFAAGSNVLGAGVYSGDASGAYNGLAGAGAGVYSGGASGAYNGLAGSGAAVYSGDASGAYNGLAGAGAAVYSGGASGAYNGLAGAGAGVGSGSESYIARGRGNGYSVGDQASGSYQTNSVSGSGAGYSSGSGAYSEELGKGYVSGSSDGSAYNAGLGAGTAYTSGSSAGFLAGGVGSSGLSLGSGGAGGPGGSGNAYTSGTGAHSGVSAGQISGIGEKYAAGGYGNSATVYSSGAQTQSGAGYIAGRVSGNGVYNAGEGISGTLHTFTGGAGDGTFSSGAKSVYSNKYAGASGIYGAGAYAGGDYSGAYIEDNSGAYIEDNSGAYIHDNSGDYKGDFSGLYSGKVVSDGQYAGGYSSGGAYVHGQYDNGAYKGSSVGGEQYKGNYVGGGAYSGSYDTGSYQGSGASDERYKEGYNTGGYSGKFDTGAYSGKYNTDGYSGKYDAGTYSGKYGVGGYSNKYDAGSYSEKNEGAYSGSSSGKYDSGFYSGKYEGGAYNGNSGAYQEGNYHSSSSSTQGGYKENHVPTTFVTDGGYASHEYNSVNVVEHKPAIGLVGLDAVKVSGGDFHSGGGYVSSYVTPTPLPAVSVTPVAPVVTSYSTVTPAPISVSKYTASTFQPTTPRPVTFYSIPSSPVTSVSSGPLASYSTVRPPLSVQTYQQPSYVKTATPTAPSYSYPTPTIGVVKTPVIPLNPVTYTYKQPIVNTEYVSSGANYNPSAHISGVTYEQQSYVKTVTPAPYYEEGSLAFAGPEYLPPLPSYRYDYKPVEGKYSYSKPAIYKSPVVPLNPVQYSTPASLPVAPLRPATHNVPVVKYTPTVLKTPVVPLNPVQYSTPVPVTYYSTPTPVKTVSFSTYSTPSPPPSYLPPLKPVTYSTPAPPVSYEYSAEPVRPISYTTPAPVTVFKTPIVPLNPVQYSTPSPAVSYEYLQPAPVQPASYAKPLRPATFSTYTTPAPVVNYEFSAPAVPVKPIVPLVSKAPLAPIQYTTPAPPRVDYSYLPPSTVDVKPVSPAITYKFASPAAVPVRPVVYSTPHKQYVAPVVIPTVLKTPVIPLNPVQYTTPAPIHFEYSTPATVPVQPLRPITYSTSAPAVSYEYLPPAPVEQVRPLRPATYSTAAPPVNREYLPPRIEPIRPLKPAVYTTTAPPVVYKEYVAPVVTPTVLKTPVVPLNPVQYTTPTPNYIEYSTPASVPVKPLSSISYTAPAPAVNYEYLPPAPVEPVRPLRPIVYSKPAPPGNHQYLHPQPVKPVTYTSTVLPPVVNYEYPAPGVKPIVPTVLKTPLVPLNPVQYTTTAPLHIQYSTPAPLPVRPITLSSPAPFSYEYLPPKQVPTVLKTPVVPLNPVQYTTPAPAILQYSTPSPVPSVSYARPLRPVTYTTPAPAISYEYATAPAYVKPLPTVLKTPVIPLNPVQYSTPAPVVNQYQFGANLKTQTQYQSGVYYQKPAVVNTQYVQENYKYDQPKPIVDFIEPQKVVSTTPAPEVTYSYETPESVTPIYKQVYNYIKTPVVSAYDKVLGAVGYSTTPAPLPVQTVTQSPVAYTPSNVGYSYSKPALVKTPSIPVTPVNVVPEYNKVLNVVKATTTPAPVYVNHYTSSYEQEVLPVSTPQPVIYKQKPIVVPETYVKDYSYEENIEDAYDALKSDFGTRLTGGYEEGHAYNQQRVVVPEVNVYTSTTPSPVPVIKETYRVRKPVITYVQTYEQPAVAVNHEAGSYGEEAFYSSTANPAVVSSSEATYGEQYHKETSYSGFTGNGGVSTPCDHGVTHTSEGPAVRITTARVSLPVVTPRPQGGYYVRKQKVRVRPVVTTENYPDIYSSTYTPSTVSTTTYAPTYPTTAAPKLTTVHPDDVVDVEENEEEVKLLEGYNRQFGGIVGQGGYVASSTVANIEDGEAVVGVLKKGRITYDGRRTKSKVVVVSKLSDFNPLLVGKLGAECSCDGRSNTVTVRRNKQRGSSRLFTPSRDSTIPDQQLSDSYRTSTSTIAPIVVSAEESYESSSYDTPVVEIRPLRKRTRFQSTTTSAPAYEEEAEEPNYVPSGNERVKVDSGRVECKRAGLFRHPNKCNKFYSCNWDQWKKKFTLHEFKCPIHLAYDVNLGACNWPSKGPACAEDNLLV